MASLAASYATSKVSSMAADELNKETIAVLKANNFTDAYIRPIAWRGDENLGVKSCNNSAFIFDNHI